MWIDQEAAHDERLFFIDHLLVEHRLMKARDGRTRRPCRGGQAGTGGSAAGPGSAESDRRRRRSPCPGEPCTRKLWKRLESAVTVWIVNGRLVRSTFDIDFTEGGHDKVYEFVPAAEVWIDDAIFEQERGYILLHELHERNRMSTGWPYGRAHAESSRIEFRCRHHPDELHDALAAEGWA